MEENEIIKPFYGLKGNEKVDPIKLTLENVRGKQNMFKVSIRIIVNELIESKN